MNLSMITDRTGTDVTTAATLRTKIQSGQSLTDSEKTAFERGACTITMINRVENAQKSLSDLLNKYKYTVNISNKTNWTNGEIFNNANYMRLLQNLRALRNAFYTYNTTPNTPTYIYGYEEANNIEKILVDINSMIESMESNFRECDTFYCGE